MILNLKNSQVFIGRPKRYVSLISKKELEVVFDVFFSFARTKHKELNNKTELSIEFCLASKIRKLNFEHRKKDKATDVLSFPLHDFYFKKIKSSHTDPILLGDIYICPVVARKQAKEFKVSLKEEIIRLLVHGLLHIIGMDHEISSKEYEKMMRIQEYIILNVARVIKHG